MSCRVPLLSAFTPYAEQEYSILYLTDYRGTGEAIDVRKARGKGRRFAGDWHDILCRDETTRSVSPLSDAFRKDSTL